MLMFWAEWAEGNSCALILALAEPSLPACDRTACCLGLPTFPTPAMGSIKKLLYPDSLAGEEAWKAQRCWLTLMHEIFDV